ncbi:MAG: hypothetical protein H7Y42_04100 [Chitinophagaceae bacterium]|nr:hypothetical protein [Chitinophagaceae bacterium]
MLTKHCYKNIPEKWNEHTDDETRRRIIDCCGVPDPNDPTGGDCCYRDWNLELKNVNQDYKAAIEEAELRKRQLVFITDRRDRYNTWVIELNKAEEKARYICQQLDVIATQTRKIWYNSCKAVKAIEILYCMITDFYFQVDDLRKKYDNLTACVSNNHDPAIGKGTGILKYADDYLAKLEIVIKTRDDLVKPVLDAIRLANLIRNSISTKKCPAPKDDKGKGYDPCEDDELCPDYCVEGGEYYGLKAVICAWYREFNCDLKCEPTIDPKLPKDQWKLKYKEREDARIKREEEKKKCDEKQDPPPVDCVCELRPSFYFPVCNDVYKMQIERWLYNDESSINTLRENLLASLKKKEALQACKDSLAKAVKEVDPKDRCK